MSDGSLSIVAEVVRSAFVEAVHTGVVIGLQPDGTTAFAIGDVDSPVFPRSCNKPLQAVGMLRCGLNLDGAALALVCASHSGLPEHVELARSILSGAGLDETALQNTPGLPVDEEAVRDLLAAGGTADRLHQNCSGKHAGMLATCVASGWSLADYLDPEHPLQVELRRAVADLAEEPVTAVGVDGCGAPLFALSVRGVARAVRALALASTGTSKHRVATAMRSYPEVVGGPDRVVTRLMAGAPGLLAKDGAEGAFVAALPDGRAVAVKIGDGASRAAGPVLVAALQRLGVTADVLTELAAARVYGGGQPVGEVHAAGLLRT